MKCTSMFSRVGGVCAAISLCCLIAAPSFAYAADAKAPTEKDETVYVYTNTDGTVKRAEVTTILKNPDGVDELSDVTSLSNLKAKNDEMYSGTGETIVWKAGGSNVTYTGDTSAAAPVSLRVSYTLDGQPVSAEQLAGKSGKVTIRYDFENHSSATATVNGSSQHIYTPFTCITALMLDGNDFKNVTVENGKVISDGDDTIVAGYAMPGLKESLGWMADDAEVPDHFIVTADVTNFELKSTMTIVTAGLMSELDTSAIGLGDLDDADALTDAMTQLISGSDTLTTGLDQMASNAKQLESGIGALQAGAQSVSYGLAALSGDEGLGKLSVSASSFADGIALIDSAVSDAKAGIETVKSNLDAQIPASDPFAGASAVLEKYQNNMEAADYAALSGALSAGTTMYESLSSVSQALGKTIASVDELSKKLGEAKANASALAGGVSAAAEKATALSYGAYELSAGFDELSAAVPQLIEGLQAAADGSKQLTDGMRTFNDQGVAQLVNTLKNDFGGMLVRMNALSDAAKSYTNFAGITPGTTGSVKFVIETDPIKQQ